MIFFLSLLCCAVALAGFLSIQRTCNAKYWMAHPAMAWGVISLMAFGFRGFYDYMGVLPGFGSENVKLEVVSYNLIFYSVYFVTLAVVIGKAKISLREFSPQRFSAKNEQKIKLAILIGSIIVTLAFLIGTKLGIFHSLGQESKKKSFGQIELFLRLGWEIRWYLVGLSVVTINRIPKHGWYGVLVVCCLEVMQTIFNGGRGHTVMAVRIIAIALFYHSTIWESFRQIIFRRGKYLGMVTSFGFAVVFVTSVLRSEKAYDDSQLSLDRFTQATSDVLQSSGETLNDRFTSMVQRMAYPFENHALVIGARNRRTPKFDYEYGSWKDTFKFVPRFVWRDKPVSTFNYYMSTYLIGRRGANTFDLPIGRVSEADYAFGHLGLLLSLLYGIVFGLAFKRGVLQSNRLISRCVYIAVFFGFFILGGACATNRLPIVIQTSICVSPVLYWLRTIRV